MQTLPELRCKINERAFSWMLFLTRLFASLVLIYISLGGFLFYREFLQNVQSIGLPVSVGFGFLAVQLILALCMLLGLFARWTAAGSIVCLSGVCYVFFGADFNKIYVALIWLLITALLPTLIVGAGKYSLDFNRARRRFYREMRG